MGAPKRREVWTLQLANRALRRFCRRGGFQYSIRVGVGNSESKVFPTVWFWFLVDGPPGVGVALALRMRRADQGALCWGRDGPDPGGNRFAVLTDILGD